MAKNLFTSNLALVHEKGALQAVNTDCSTQARLGQVHLDGAPLDGVFAEVQDGALGSVAQSGGHYTLPAGVKARDAYLRKFAKANRLAARAGTGTVLLLSLAACVGEGGKIIEVTPDGLVAAGDAINIFSAKSGLLIKIQNDPADIVAYDDVEVNVQGGGTVTFQLEDANDVFVANDASDIVGFDTIVVERGTVNFTQTELPASVKTLKLDAGAMVDLASFNQLTVIESMIPGVKGTVTVALSNADEARAVLASPFAKAVSIEIAIAGGDAGVLTVAEHAELLALTEAGGNDDWGYSLSDTIATVFNADGTLNVAVDLLGDANAVTLSGTLNLAQWQTLQRLDKEGLVDLDLFQVPSLTNVENGVVTVEMRPDGLTVTDEQFVDVPTTNELSFGDGDNTITLGAKAALATDALTVTTGSGDDIIDASALGEPITVESGAGDDQIIGSAEDDVLDAGDGSDTLTGGAGVDDLSGGAGSDTFLYGDQEFIAGETVDGGDGVDIIKFTAEAETVVDAEFANKSNLEKMSFADGANTLTLAADAAAALGGDGTVGAGATIEMGAGVDTVTLVDLTEAMTVQTGAGDDAVTVSAAGKAAVAVAHDIDLGAGADTVSFAKVDDFDAVALAAGGDAGSEDEVLLTADAQTIADEDFDTASGIDKLTLADGANSVTLGSAAKAALDDATVTTGADDDTINISALGEAVTIISGDGDDDVTGSSSAQADSIDAGAGDDEISFVTAADMAAATVDGGAGTDTISLSQPGQTVVDSDFAKIVGNSVERLELADGSATNVTLGSAAAAALAPVAGELGAVVTLADGAVDTVDLTNLQEAIILRTLGGVDEVTVTSAAGSATAVAHEIDLGAGSDTINFETVADFAAVTLKLGTAGGGDLVNITTDDAQTLVDDDFTNAGGAGIDEIILGDGGNTVTLGSKAAAALGWSDNEDAIVQTGGGADKIDISALNEAVTIIGNDGNDTITGSASAQADAFHAGAGDDLIKFTTAANMAAADINGGVGDDTVELTTAQTVVDADFDWLYTNSVEGLKLADGGNTVTLGADAAAATMNLTVTGGSGIDTIDATNLGEAVSVDAGDGADALTGSALGDTLKGGDGNDTIVALDGNDSLVGGKGEDTIRGNDGDDTIEGGEGDDWLYGNGGDNSIAGGAGDDYIDASSGVEQSGVNIVLGGFGDDTIHAGADLTADDTIDGGTDDDEDDFDVFYFSDSDGLTTRNELDNVTNFEKIVVQSATAEVTTADTLIAAGKTLEVDASGLQSSNHTLDWDGSAETDGVFSITGGDFDDTIHSGAGNDTIKSGEGADRVYLTAGNNTVDAGEGNDWVYGGTGNDSINLGTGNDRALFNDVRTLTSADTVTGGTAADSDEVWVELDTSVSLTLDEDFTLIDILQVVDRNTGAYDASITLASDFDNGEKITFNATTLDDGETFTLDASAFDNTQGGHSGHSLQVNSGAGADTVKLGNGDDLVNSGDGNDLVSLRIDDLNSDDTLTAGDGTDTLEFTTSGSIADVDFTIVSGFETLKLANGSNTVVLGDAAYNSGNGILSVETGTGVDEITTYDDLDQRGDLTIDLKSDNSVDAVSIRNDLLTTDSTTLSGGGITKTQTTDSETLTFDDFVFDSDGASGSVTIEGFVSGDGGDRLNVIFNSDNAPTITSSTSFANDYTLNSAGVLNGINDGGVIEISSDRYQLSEFGWDLEDVAAVLSNGGDGNALLGLKDGSFVVAIYDGQTEDANAHIFSIRVDDGDGLDFGYVQGQFEAGASGTDEFSDLDAIEYLGYLSDVGADTLTSQNFA